MVQKRLVFVLVLASCVLTAALAVTLTMLLEGRGEVAGIAGVAGAQTLVPPCPQADYGADGNMGPLFCVIANPVALRYFAPMAKRTFALGPEATPTQVAEALVTDTRPDSGQRWKLSLPMLCSIYHLAAWKNQWHFGISIAFAVSQRLNATPGWCGDAEFTAEDVER
jgi:hypothetical protein